MATNTTNPDEDNIFEDVLTNAKAAEEKYMGPDYPYYKYIKTPAAMGMSGKGSLAQLGKDVDGLVNYVELLVSGSGKASATGKPLGNKFFLKTGGKCTSTTTKADEDRFIYIDNVPEGNIPFISGGLGVNFSEFKGLIPGTISNLNAFNPLSIFQSFLSGAKPDCQELTMETIDIHNNRSTETHYVTLVDIQNMDPCSFTDKKNPVTGNKCQETFSNQTSVPACYTCYSNPPDAISSIYSISLGILGTYIIYRVMTLNGLIPKH